MSISKEDRSVGKRATNDVSSPIGEMAGITEVREFRHTISTDIHTYRVQSTATVAAESFVVIIQRNVSQPFSAAFVAGGIAGAVSRTVVSPLERLKILYQVQSAGRNEYQMSIYKALRKMWTEEGWRGFMRGNGTNCVRIIPYSAVQFGSYNVYKKVGGMPGVPNHLLILSSSRNHHRELICHHCEG